METMKRLTNLLTLWNRPKPPVGTTPADVVHQENSWKLLRYRPRAQGLSHRRPVLLVPSLINKHYVLDLLPEKSFAAYLVGQGFDVFCIDWGKPNPEDRFTTFDDVVDGYLGRAIRIAAKASPDRKTHLLGYCMGGTLTAIHGAVHSEHIASMATLAAPVVFQDTSMLSRWTNASGFDVDSLVDALGNVPWQLLQSAFLMLRPTLTLQKAMNVIDRAWNDEFLDGFLAVETWGNDNVSLPGEFYRTYIRDLYRADALKKKQLMLRGRPVDLAKIRFPVMAVTFEHDSIVLASSAKPLVDMISSEHKQHVHLPGGHVGAVVSKHAAKSLWPMISAFYEKFDGDARDAEPKVVAAKPQPVVAKASPPRQKKRARPGRAPAART